MPLAFRDRSISDTNVNHELYSACDQPFRVLKHIGRLQTAHLSGVDQGFLHVGIVPDDAADRRVFSGIYRFLRPCILVLLHTHLVSPSSALKTSMLRAMQISLLTHSKGWCEMRFTATFLNCRTFLPLITCCEHRDPNLRHPVGVPYASHAVEIIAPRVEGRTNCRVATTSSQAHIKRRTVPGQTDSPLRYSDVTDSRAGRPQAGDQETPDDRGRQASQLRGHQDHPTTEELRAWSINYSVACESRFKVQAGSNNALKSSHTFLVARDPRMPLLAGGIVRKRSVLLPAEFPAADNKQVIKVASEESLVSSPRRPSISPGGAIRGPAAGQTNTTLPARLSTKVAPDTVQKTTDCSPPASRLLTTSKSECFLLPTSSLLIATYCSEASRSLFPLVKRTKGILSPGPPSDHLIKRRREAKKPIAFTCQRLDIAATLMMANFDRSVICLSAMNKWRAELCRDARVRETEIPEKTRRPVASFSTMPTCENPAVTALGIKPALPRCEASSVTSIYTTAAPLMIGNILVFDLASRHKATPSGIERLSFPGRCLRCVAVKISHSSESEYKNQQNLVTLSHLNKNFLRENHEFLFIYYLQYLSMKPPQNGQLFYKFHLIALATFWLTYGTFSVFINIHCKADLPWRNRLLRRAACLGCGRFWVQFPAGFVWKSMLAANLHQKDAKVPTTVGWTPVGPSHPASRSEEPIRATLTRTPSASSLLRARSAVFPRSASQLRHAKTAVTYQQAAIDFFGWDTCGSIAIDFFAKVSIMLLWQYISHGARKHERTTCVKRPSCVMQQCFKYKCMLRQGDKLKRHSKNCKGRFSAAKKKRPVLAVGETTSNGFYLKQSAFKGNLKDYSSAEVISRRAFKTTNQALYNVDSIPGVVETLKKNKLSREEEEYMGKCSSWRLASVDCLELHMTDWQGRPAECLAVIYTPRPPPPRCAAPADDITALLVCRSWLADLLTSACMLGAIFLVKAAKNASYATRLYSSKKFETAENTCIISATSCTTFHFLDTAFETVYLYYNVNNERSTYCKAGSDLGDRHMINIVTCSLLRSVHGRVEEKERELSYMSDGGRHGNDGFPITAARHGL
ncbi:hypothetical protein PR048_005668 [Dryococelus australis]|uniref:Uncharacterized protein n=1 Tax=Dryococelus australis TaxID=614101 RepID=A0ABQ9I8T5_9NEOP|nr:hypothetical protein PR048_005668 [Dryococelus australis]